MADHPDRPGPESLHKTEFPASWSDQKILDSVTDVARNPDVTPLPQAWNHRWLTRGDRDGVEIVAVAQSDGRICSAWPLEGGAGVVRNPTEATS